MSGVRDPVVVGVDGGARWVGLVVCWHGEVLAADTVPACEPWEGGAVAVGDCRALRRAVIELLHVARLGLRSARGGWARWSRWSPPRGTPAAGRGGPGEHARGGAAGRAGRARRRAAGYYRSVQGGPRGTSRRQLNRWAGAGLLGEAALAAPGSGHYRSWTADQVEAAAVLARLVALGWRAEALREVPLDTRRALLIMVEAVLLDVEELAG